MVKISEVHPTTAHSLGTTIKILEAAIELRQKEIDNMRACILSCQKVAADDVLPATEEDANLQQALNGREQHERSRTIDRLLNRQVHRNTGLRPSETEGTGRTPEGVQGGDGGDRKRDAGTT